MLHGLISEARTTIMAGVLGLLSHFHENWASLDARRLVLNAVAWIAKVDVPEGGVPTQPVTLEHLPGNQDFPLPNPWKKNKM